MCFHCFFAADRPFLAVFSRYGPGLSRTEQWSQLALWSVLASPLLVSFDVRSMSAECKALVTNKRAIAVHQDGAGVPGRAVGLSCLTLIIGRFFKGLS